MNENNRIDFLKKRLQEIEKEKEELECELSRLTSSENRSRLKGTAVLSKNPETPEEKIDLGLSEQGGKKQRYY
jgi:prefoldin subunit 5